MKTNRDHLLGLKKICIVIFIYLFLIVNSFAQQNFPDTSEASEIKLRLP